jgi:hypothetical protein
MGHPIDFNKLDGTWRLQYTSAPDVLILFQAAANLPFFQVLYPSISSFLPYHHFPSFLSYHFYFSLSFLLS